MTRALVSLRGGWNRFWFTPTSTAPVELFRIGFGSLATLWFLSMAPVMSPFLGAEAAVPVEPLPAWSWSLFDVIGGSPGIWFLWLLGLLGAIGVLLGYWTRAAAIVVFVITMSVTRSAPTVFNAGDGLVRILGFYMMFMPAGSAVSADRWLKDPAGMWSFPRRAPWALRLVQIQVCAVYVATIWEKTGGILWRNGTAVSYTLRVDDITRIPTPRAVADSVVISELMTYGTLAIEVGLAVLVWNKAARPYVLWLGVLLHVSIELTIDVGFFSLAIMTAYLAFVSPDAATRTLRWVPDRWWAWRTGRDRPGASTSTSTARAVPAARRGTTTDSAARARKRVPTATTTATSVSSETGGRGSASTTNAVGAVSPRE